MEITTDRTHNIIVFAYAMSIALLSMVIEDLSLILGIYSSFCESFNDFFLPGALIYYTLRYKRYKYQGIKLIAIAWFCIGLVYWSIANYFNLKKI